MADEKDNVQEVYEAIGALRSEFKNHGVDSPEFKEMTDKVDGILTAQEEKNQELIKEMGEEKQKALDMKERMDALEIELTRSNQKKGDWKLSPEYKALNQYAKVGDLNVEEKALMRMDNSVAGGYLVSTEMDTSIIKKITEVSPVRSVARVQTVGKKTLEIPVRTAIPEATYEGEAAAGSESASTYGNETLTAYRLTTTVPFTMDMMMDSNWDLMAEINQDVSESFAQKEGNKFVLGTGAKQPEGFAAKASLQTAALTSEASGAISAKDMTDLTGLLKVGYNPMYGFNRQTLAYLRSLEDGAGNPIWQVNMGDGAPNTINGEPYVILQDMAAIAANSYSVVYADFMRGYRIIDRTGLTMIRDDVTQKKNAIVELTFHRWNTGQVVLDEAFALLKTKA